MESQMDVLLVAVKKDKILNHTNVLAQAGKTPTVVDIDAFALQNCYEVNYDPDPAQTVALLNIGASVMNINIVRGGMPLFTRDVSVGGNQYTDALQKELDLSYEDAERLKKGEAIAGVAEEHRGTILRSVSDILILEIQKTFDFFRATADRRKHPADLSGWRDRARARAGGPAPRGVRAASGGALSVSQDRDQSRPAQRRPGARTRSAPGHRRGAGAQELRHAMIRINLLGRARPKAQRQAVPLEATLQVVFFLAALVVALGVLYYNWHSTNEQITEVRLHIQKQSGEKARLEKLKMQVDEFERQKGVLQQRINIIEQLQRNRTGGQELLDALADTVTRTDTLWLTSLDRQGRRADDHGHGGIDQRGGQLHHPAQALGLLRPGRDQGIDAGHQERGHTDVCVHADGAVRAAARQIGGYRPGAGASFYTGEEGLRGQQWRPSHSRNFRGTSRRWSSWRWRFC